MTTRRDIIGWVLGACGLVACAPDEGPQGSGVEVRVAAEVDSPLDATPDPAGRSIYFLAQHEGGRALLRVDEAGAVTAVATGLGEARSLAFSADGAALAVADGGVERIAAMDGARTRIAEAEDFDVRGVEVVRDGGSDVVFFTGVDPMDGEVGVFRVPLAGGAVEVVSKGFADADLDGLTRASDGTIYASDLGGRLWRARAGEAPEAVVTGFVAGDPAGVALTSDGSTLLISALSDAGTSEVVLLDTAMLTTSVFNDVIGENVASGGVHRAHTGDTFAWCGVAKGGDGLVYRIEL